MDLVRLWDCLFIFGFDFAHKFALVLLSKYERVFRNHIKEEIAALNQGSSVDALIVAGNAAILKLLKRTDKIPLEKLIRKAVAKPNYAVLSREQFQQEAENLEKENDERVIRLRTSTTFFREKETDFAGLGKILAEMEKMKSGELVSRRMFQTLFRNYGWSEKVALNVFVTFDQRGTDAVSLRELQLGVTVLWQGSWDDKLALVFAAFDEEKTGEIAPNVAIEIISSLELALDQRSAVFADMSSGLFLAMQRRASGAVSFSSFLTAVKEHSSVRPIFDLLSRVEGSEVLTTTDMRLVDFSRSGDFSNILSPLASSDFANSVSDHEDEVPDPVDLEARLELLLQNDLREDVSEDAKFTEAESNSREKWKTQVIPPPPLTGSDPRSVPDSARRIGLDTIEESKEESEDNRSKREDPAPSVKDLNGRSGCSRLCTKDMCVLS